MGPALCEPLLESGHSRGPVGTAARSFLEASGDEVHSSGVWKLTLMENAVKQILGPDRLDW